MSAPQERKWTTTRYVVLPCYGDGGLDERLCDPPEHELHVAVVAERVFIDLVTEEKPGVTRRIGAATVNAEALLNALVAQMDVERTQLVPYPLALRQDRS